MEWISVKDKLPEQDGDYLVVTKWLTSKCAMLTFWDIPTNPKWLIASTGADLTTTVTHWMPLPKLPKER